MARGRHLIQTGLAVVRVELVAEDVILMDEKGLSFLLLLQPPVPPSLPSVPSSSTPLPGPVESSPASQSPTTPASSEPCNKLNLVAGQ
ncbi:hypothetical protein JCGZ_03231 [Jatropha curcas]|uniref:Uncharacterized protein n=1 Tax=Jatropha curcas TaxID=180498 RepID=A0A067KY11_JATCU|nr:hypothetical protein JCGZ_03231 [Jatropha curcas]